MAKVKVTLKDGREIQVLRQEVQGLRKAGLLKKEHKDPAETKEEKHTGETKAQQAPPPKQKPAPVNISAKSFKKK